MELCHVCGHENQKELVACEKCGSILDDSSRKEREAEKQRLKELSHLMETAY